VAGITRQVINPGCLGQMAQKYCKYCSERCPITALCVLILMGEYLRRDQRVTPSEESADAHFLTIPPLIVPPDEL